MNKEILEKIMNIGFAILLTTISGACILLWFYVISHWHEIFHKNKNNDNEKS